MNTAAMRAGRRRWEKERRRDAVRRVRTFRAWLKAGSETRSIPEIPTDADYAAFRAAGGSRGR